MNIESLHLDDETLSGTESESSPDEPQGFWRRQFQQQPTKTQNVFDWSYGVVVPLICVAADPIVFRNGGWSGALLGTYRPFAYLLSAVSILAMAAWLLWGDRLRWVAAPIAGLFFVGSGISLVVGLILLPFSLFGLLVLIGALGFTPLFSSVVYLRNGTRAYRSALLVLEDQATWQATLLAAVFSFVIPYVVNFEISRLVNSVVKGDVATIQRESRKLRWIAPLVDPSLVSKRYHYASADEISSGRMNELARVYEDLSGEDINDGPRGWD